jgi:predicted Ser/Thr protein kinase
MDEPSALKNSNLQILKQDEKKVLYVFDKGISASKVERLTDGSVSKRYPQSKKNLFWTEVKTLQRLSNCDFVPKLLSVDETNLVIRMSYCGTSVPDTKAIHQEIHDKLKSLEKLWGVYRSKNIGKKLYTLSKLENATYLNKKVYLIDFGSTGWKRINNFASK